MDRLLSDTFVAISNIAGYPDTILHACAYQDHQLMASERTQQGHGEPVGSLQMSMSNVRTHRAH
jgi:hypothetical protein